MTPEIGISATRAAENLRNHKQEAVLEEATARSLSNNQGGRSVFDRQLAYLQYLTNDRALHMDSNAHRQI
jgi:hypothetical protein